ncbi:MAG TPA: c-type cytochrome, partial [Puia sp.]|nr:c-type cytochrome [Puia sp.]
MANKKSTVITGLAFAVVLCTAAVSPGDGLLSGNHGPNASANNSHGDYKNLKVLPRDIPSKALQHIMVDEFDDGLGVGCGFCHAKQNGSDRLDYASDAKPEKEIARTMM